MAEIEMPRRDQVILIQCRCLVLHWNKTIPDRCQQVTASPDEPFCQDCARDHQIIEPLVPDGSVVTAVPLGDKRG